MKRKKRRLTLSEIRAHVEEQARLLRASCAAFDAGREESAKDMAARLRLLLHDTRSSHSLLGQLGHQFSWKFPDSAFPFRDGLLPTYHGLVCARLSTVPGERPGSFEPLLRTIAGPHTLAPFRAWWSAMVFRDKEWTAFSRRDIVLTVANQDGGVHVDPEVDESYDALARREGLGITLHSGEVKIDWSNSPVPGSIRQIAHEVLTTVEQQGLSKP